MARDIETRIEGTVLREESLVNGSGRGALLHEEFTGPIIGAFYDVYNELGTGFVESVYERAMEIALATTKLRFERQPRLSAYFRGSVVGEFRPDFVVEGRVVVELKAGRTLEPTHEAQLINYLRCGGVEVGLLFNFGPKPCFRRLLFTTNKSSQVTMASRDSPQPSVACR